MTIVTYLQRSNRAQKRARAEVKAQVDAFKASCYVPVILAEPLAAGF